MRASFVVVLLVALAAAPVRAQQEEDLFVYSTSAGGGALTVDGPLAAPIVVTPRLPFCPAGICPYSSVNPGFLTPATNASATGPFALTAGTRVTLSLVAIDPAASLKIGATVLDAAGDTALLGSAPDVHVHPEWQLQLPQGVVGDYPVTFRLTATGAYASSVDYTALLTNRAAAGPTPTPSATPVASVSATVAPSPTHEAPATSTPADTPSATPTASNAACAGDCDGDGSVGVHELVAGVALALDAAPPIACPALDRDGDGRVGVPELVRAVGHALAGC